MPNQPRPRLARRLLAVGATWAVLAVVALLVGPYVALTAALIPLALAARGALAARAAGRWKTEEHIIRRQVTGSAMLIAGGLFAVTFWRLREMVPSWAIPMELAMLLHYWLMTLN